MNESSFVAALHRKLCKSVYHHKNFLLMASGIPDVWYSGPKGDLWIEYKWLSTAPLKRHKPNLTPIQADWLNSRCNEGRNVAVAVGTPDGVLLYQNKNWNESQPIALMPYHNFITWIEAQTGKQLG